MEKQVYSPLGRPLTYERDLETRKDEKKRKRSHAGQKSLHSDFIFVLVHLNIISYS